MCEERERNNLLLREVSVLFIREMLRLRVYFDELLLLLFTGLITLHLRCHIDIVEDINSTSVHCCSRPLVVVLLSIET